MKSRLRLLVDQFAQNPATTGKAMRDLLESDAGEFTRHALELVKKVAVGPGSNYLLTLLLRDPSSLQKLDPRFDVRIIKKITSTATRADQLEPVTAERMLDLISAFSDGSRTLPVLTELLSHTNPRIRSKAALLIGRARGGARLTESRLQETDKRVRANAIEALWGNQSNEARSILSAAVTDTDNRVAANAALGLYRIDETYSIGIILEMAANLSPLFRVSAVWAMSETQDPRFLGTLAKLIADGDPRVRHLAFNAVAKIRKNKTSLLKGPKLKLLAAEVDRGEVDGSMEKQHKVRVSVSTEDGKPVAHILGVQFALDENKLLVTEYSVVEMAQSEIPAAGIAEPLTLDPENEVGERSISYEITYVSNSAMPTSRLSVQVYSPEGCGEQTCEVTGNVPKESAIESPTLHESSAHSLAPDLAPRS